MSTDSPIQELLVSSYASNNNNYHLQSLEKTEIWNQESGREKRAAFRDCVIENCPKRNYKEIIADHTAKHQVSLIIHEKAQFRNCVRLLRKMPWDLKYSELPGL